MNDRVIREYAHSKILQRFYADGESLVVDEFPVCDGEARADIVVVNGELHAYEIKSTHDKLSRLPGQVESYSKVFDRVTLIADRKHLEGAEKIIPGWWGILSVEPDVESLRVKNVRVARRNPAPEPLALAQLLWAYEARLILEGHGLFKGLGGKPRKCLWETLAENFPSRELNWLVRKALKIREKTEHWWRRPPPVSTGSQEVSLEDFLLSLSRVEQEQTLYGG